MHPHWSTRPFPRSPELKVPRKTRGIISRRMWPPAFVRAVTSVSSSRATRQRRWHAARDRCACVALAAAALGLDEPRGRRLEVTTLTSVFRASRAWSACQCAHRRTISCIGRISPRFLHPAAAAAHVTALPATFLPSPPRHWRAATAGAAISDLTFSRQPL